MACNFTIPFTGPATDLITKAKNAINTAGGTLSGDETSGSFNLTTPIGGIDGTYTISVQNLNIVINNKPLLVSCGEIENKLSGLIS